MAKKMLTVEGLLRRRAAWLRANGYGGALRGQEAVPVGRRAPVFGEADALTPARLAASLAVGNFPTHSVDTAVYDAVCKFRHLRQDARVAAARRALS